MMPFIDRGLNLSTSSSIFNESALNCTSPMFFLDDAPLDSLTEHQFPWKEGTTLITGDSMLTGLDEKKLRNCKVRIHPGAGITDMFYHLGSHLRKKPSRVILLTGTNDCMNNDWSRVIEKMLQLQIFIEERVPNCEVIFSTLIPRFDNHKAQQAVCKVNQELMKLKLNVMKNGHFEREHVGKKGLHLNPRGVGKLITNFVNFLKNL